MKERLATKYMQHAVEGIDYVYLGEGKDSVIYAPVKFIMDIYDEFIIILN